MISFKFLSFNFQYGKYLCTDDTETLQVSLRTNTYIGVKINKSKYRISLSLLIHIYMYVILFMVLFLDSQFYCMYTILSKKILAWGWTEREMGQLP